MCSSDSGFLKDLYFAGAVIQRAHPPTNGRASNALRQHLRGFVRSNPDLGNGNRSLGHHFLGWDIISTEAYDWRKLEKRIGGDERDSTGARLVASF